jgi:hypothetical protein
MPVYKKNVRHKLFTDASLRITGKREDVPYDVKKGTCRGCTHLVEGMTTFRNNMRLLTR